MRRTIAAGTSSQLSCPISIGAVSAYAWVVVVEHSEGAPTVLELLSAVIERRGDLPALFERDGERLTRVTFAELGRAVAALSCELDARGVGPGDVVGVWLPNWIEMVV